MSRLSQEAAQQILSEHNCARARYNSGPLQWDWELAADAQVHADRCGFWHSSEIGKLPQGQGENLSINTGSVNTSGWIDEEGAYDCKTGNCRSAPCGHWTQMIWNDTERVGCAIQRCANGTVDPQGNPVGWMGAELLVCRYSPPGNYKGQTPVGSTQCDAGAKNSGCGDSSKFPQVSSSGRGVGAIVAEGTAASRAAGASRYNQGDTEIWRKQPAVDSRAQATLLNVPLSIVDMTQTNGQKLFPWRTSQRIVKQYTPEDVKFFIDNYARDKTQIDSLTYREIVRAMVQIEQMRKARGNIYVRPDQRELLDKLPPQHLSPLLSLLQGLPTFYHTALVDRFFEQLYKGDKGALARIASGREQLSSTQADNDFANSISKRSEGNLDFSELDTQEQNLTARFKGQISDESRAENQKIAAAVQGGTATAEQAITSAYVLDARQEEETGIGSILLKLLLLVAILFVLFIVVLAISAAAKGTNIVDEFASVRSNITGIK